MKEIIDVQLNNEYDVIVLGGGPSGCAAAISSARAGVKTLLLERSFALGGMSTNGMVAWAPMDDGEKFVYRSIALEIVKKARKNISFFGENEFGWVPNFFEETKRALDELISESGTKVIFGATVCAAKKEKDTIQSIIVSSKKGLTEYVAKTYVDCTGDADIVHFLGLPYEKSANLQPATLCFTLGNVNIEEYIKNLGRIAPGCAGNWLQQAIRDDVEFPLLKDTHLCVGRNCGDTIDFNAGHLYQADGTDDEQVTQSVMLGRKMAFQYRDAMAKYMPEVFGNSFVAQTASVLGTRESRRIIGDYTLTLQDYIERKSFPDEIARNCYWIDIHVSQEELEKHGKDYQFSGHNYEVGESHGIPMRCLIPQGVNNMTVGGRAISCEHEVMGSIRIMPCCMATGEAAGLLAALSAKNHSGVREIPPENVRKILRERGAFIL